MLVATAAANPSITAVVPTRRNRTPAKKATPNGATKRWLIRSTISTRFHSSLACINSLTASAMPTPATPAAAAVAMADARLFFLSEDAENRSRKSVTTTDEIELMPELKLDIAAANNAASRSPETPEGKLPGDEPRQFLVGVPGDLLLELLDGQVRLLEIETEQCQPNHHEQEHFKTQVKTADTQTLRRASVTDDVLK